jgi:hypothetical protein
VKYVANIWERTLVGELEERNILEDFCHNGGIILNDFQEVGWRCNLY